MRYLETFLRGYKVNYVSMPRGSVSKKEIRHSLKRLSDRIQQCTSKMAVYELSRILDLRQKDIQKLISSHINLLRNYYMIPFGVSNKAAAELMNLKIREAPLVYFSLILGLIRFSGMATNLLSIDRYLLLSNLKHKAYKVTVPKRIFPEHRVLSRITQSHIDYHPDALLFLIVNYAGDYELKTKGSITPLELLLYSFAIRAVK